MPRFTIQYHLTGTDFVPQEGIDAETPADAAKIAGERMKCGQGDDTILMPTDNDFIAVPCRSIIYCYVRAVVDRRRAASSVPRPDFEEEETSVQ